ncbi:MAG: signal recognition particle-docking protein FtsY [Polyangiaceae bacterium]|nr:signal recognition particle-docking protein FtsY [Polyangiaceae bacterium]
MGDIVYVLGGLIALAAIYFLFFRKPAETPKELPAPEPEPARREPAPKAGGPSARAAEPEPKAEPRKAAAEPAPKPVAAPAAKPAREAEPEPAKAAPAPPPEPPPPPSAAPDRPSLTPKRDVGGLRRGLARSREEGGFFAKLRSLLGGRKDLSPDVVADLEEALLASDVGVATTETMVARVRETLSSASRVNEIAVWDALRAEARRVLSVGGKAGPFTLRAHPTVVLMVGVNGAGKTTTIGKLATRLGADGKKCVLAAGDTFRAAAVQQLVVWGDRVGCEVVRGKDGGDPGSVVFEAVQRAKTLGADVVLADTAGRLHTKTNLMAEMKKIAKTTAKAMDGAPHEILLVVDATNGQNALAQAAEFKDTLEVTGIVLTKLDGTAKGGVILGIADTLGLPVRFVGLGERADDLHPFVPENFVEALLGADGEAGVE